VWETIAEEAASESRLWGEALLPPESRRHRPIFSPLGPSHLALGVETIYEGYLVHYGTPRLFAPPDADTALLLGDYLYAHGLVRVAATGDVTAVADLAELISLCARSRAAGADGDAVAWAATVSRLGRGGLDDARRALGVRGDAGPLERVAREAAEAEKVELALAAHARLVG
jgi:hypothetical protein